jgi:hypothetical protein
MSDEESPFDQDELQEAFGDEGNEYGDTMTPEEVFSMVMINKRRLVKTTIELRDEHGETIPLHEVIADLLEYMKDKLKSEEVNQMADQIFPMMGQALVSGLGRLIGNSATAYYLANEVSRLSFIQMMCLSFLLLKYVQEKKLTIFAVDEPVSETEVESVQRKSKANSLAMMGHMMGMSYKDILRELVDKGELTDDDLSDILREKKSNDPEPNE